MPSVVVDYRLSDALRHDLHVAENLFDRLGGNVRVVSKSPVGGTHTRAKLGSGKQAAERFRQLFIVKDQTQTPSPSDSD